MIVGIAGLLLVGLAVFAVYRQLTDKGLTAEQPTQAYYTTDDGATLFASPRTTVPPFEKDGKTAVLAHVFSCDKGKTRFVGYLVKFNEDFAKRAAAEAAAAAKSGTPPKGGGLMASPSAAMSMLVKKPGSSEWLPFTSPKASNITNLWCDSRDPWDLVEQYPKN